MAIVTTQDGLVVDLTRPSATVRLEGVRAALVSDGSYVLAGHPGRSAQTPDGLRVEWDSLGPAQSLTLSLSVGDGFGPGETLALSCLWLAAGNDPHESLERYAERLRDRMQIRLPPTVPCGWISFLVALIEVLS